MQLPRTTSQPLGAGVATRSESKSRRNQTETSSQSDLSEGATADDEGSSLRQLTDWEWDIAVLLTDFACAVRDSDGPLGQQLQRLVTTAGDLKGRPRSPFTLPPPDVVLWQRCIASRVKNEEVSNSLQKYTFVRIAAQNALHGERTTGPLGHPSSTQAAAIANIVDKVVHM